MRFIKNIKKQLVVTLLVLMAFQLTAPVLSADAVTDVVVTLGEDLTAEQKASLLEEMDMADINEADIVYVTNEEEHQYLGDVVPKEQIGTRAISSAKISLREDESGIMVTTENITYITSKMYANALATAGITGAEIYVTAPFNVSGTGALTGILKAYEQSTGEALDEDLKKAANEEMVITADLAEDENVSEDEAIDFINKIKEEVDKQKPETTEELRALIQRLAEEMGLTLTDEQLDQLVNLFNKLKDLNIDWDKVNDTIDKTKDWINDFAESEEGQGIITAVKDFFSALWDWFKSVFTNEEEAAVNVPQTIFFS